VSPGILVLRALGVGDLLTAVPALRALRAAFPDDRLVLATRPHLADLVELVDAVDELLPTDDRSEVDWPGEPPRLAVNLHGRGPESTAALLATDPGTVMSHRHPDFPGVDGPEWTDQVHEVDRWCRLLEYYSVPTRRDDLALPPPPGPSPADGAVVLHPGAAYGSCRWPAERFARVASRLAGAGNRVVVTGDATETDLARSVAEQAGLPDSAVLAGRTSLADLAALVAAARLVVSNDTGTGHLATAFGTPSVVLFGPTSPQYWGPPADRAQHVALWAGQNDDPFADSPGTGLLRLTEDDVLAAADKLVGGDFGP
jgi:ADP-heptose:LPS heptosyltransferase